MMSAPNRHCLRTAGLAAVFVLAACGNDGGTATHPGNKAGGKPGEDRPVPVVTAPVASATFSQEITGIATLRAREAVLVTAPASGRVRDILFQEGARVSAGAVLVRLEDDRERAEFNAARAQAELQAARHARIQTLRQRGLVADDERDAADQALKEAQARLELARVALALRTVQAPFAGVLGFRQVSPGALVQPGDAIVSLDAVDTLRATFSLPETQIAAVTTGSAVSGQAAAWPTRTFTGTVTLVGTRVDEKTRAVDVQARLDNRDGALRPGMLLTVKVAARPRTALFVPEAALVPENARQYVWRIDGNRQARRIEVTTGVRRDGTAEITAGVVAGDRIVVEGQGNLRDGRTVTEGGQAAGAANAPAPAPRTGNAAEPRR